MEMLWINCVDSVERSWRERVLRDFGESVEVVLVECGDSVGRMLGYV